MTDEITYCASAHHEDGCDDEDCTGCREVFAELGLLCRPCHGRLVSLIGPAVPIQDAERNAESVATVARWMAANLGQHLRAPGGDAHGNVESMDRTVDVAVAMRDLQIGLAEWAQSHADDHDHRGPDDTDPEAVALWLRRRLERLARWEPVAEMVADLRAAVDRAHAVAPWRPVDRRCVGVSCQTCRHQTLVIPAGQVDVWCETCGAVHDRAVYDRWAALMAWEADVEQRLARAGLDLDGLATLTELHHALEVPRETLRRWTKGDEPALTAIACAVEDRSLLFATRDAVVVAKRFRHT